MQYPTNLVDFEQMVISTATAWTTFYQRGPHNRVRTDHDTEAAAVKHAAEAAQETGKSVMVYAVTESGRSTLAHVLRPQR